jgi:serine/threonine protein kinase
MRLHDILDHLSVNPTDRAELEDFLKLMLRLRPTERASAAVLLNHAWLHS